jgi:hypothetical protein
LIRFLLILGLAVSSLGLGPAPASADANAEARVFFEQGNRSLAQAMRSRGAVKRRHLEEALESYVQSLRIVRSRNVIFNAGIATEELGWVNEAFGYYTDYLAMPDLADDERAEGERRLAALRPRVAIVGLESDPPGASVRLDRRDLAEIGRTPLEVAVPPGEHALFLELRGYGQTETRVVAVLGERTAVRADLVVVPIPVRVLAPSSGRLFVNGNSVEAIAELSVPPGRHRIRFERPDGAVAEEVIVAEPGSDPITVELRFVDPERVAVRIESNIAVRLSIDGAEVDDGDRLRALLAPGNHALRAVANGYDELATTIDVEPGSPRQLLLDMAPTETGETTLGVWPYVFWIGAGATAATAAGFSVHALDVKNEFDTATTPGTLLPPSEQQALAEDTRNANTRADALWITAVAFGVTALVLELLNEDVPPRASTLEVSQ